jgi:hypothetical protein
MFERREKLLANHELEAEEKERTLEERFASSRRRRQYWAPRRWRR